MRAQGHDWDRVWASIKHMIAKSLVAIQPILQYHYRSAVRPDDDGFSCFEVRAPSHVQASIVPESYITKLFKHACVAGHTASMHMKLAYGSVSG